MKKEVVSLVGAALLHVKHLMKDKSAIQSVEVNGKGVILLKIGDNWFQIRITKKYGIYELEAKK